LGECSDVLINLIECKVLVLIDTELEVLIRKDIIVIVHEPTVLDIEIDVILLELSFKHVKPHSVSQTWVYS
jgi:hypothetical protein